MTMRQQVPWKRWSSVGGENPIQGRVIVQWANGADGQSKKKGRRDAKRKGDR